jgi:two-component system cell cycle response regulator DivK
MTMPLNILLVDDDARLAKGTAKLLQRLGGHNVLTCDMPTEIMSQCQTGTIDLVLMDVNLPGAEWEGQPVSGADLSRYLKTNPQTAMIPIILVTAYAMSSERQTLLETSQADAFFAKPITDYQALLDLIGQLGDR